MVLYIYMDESGDLGFNFEKGSSKNFVITLVVTNNDAPLCRCMKKARDKILQKKLHQRPELKANESNEQVISRVLNEFLKIDAQVHYIVVNKERVYEYLRTNKKKLYNYIAGIILQETKIVFNKIVLKVDKREPKLIARQDFDQYITEKLKSSGVDVDICHLSSVNDQGLQVVDHVCWSIFRKYERADDKFYNVFRDKITTSKKLWE